MSDAVLQSFLQQLPKAYQALQQQQLRQVQAFLDAHRLDHPAWRALALELALSADNSEQAREICRQLPQANSEYAIASLRMAQYYLVKRERSACRVALSEVAKAPLQDAGFYRAVAAVYSGLDDPAQALPWLEQAVQWQPADAPLRFDLALSQFFLNQMPEVASNLALVLQQLPLQGKVLHLRSAAHTATATDNHIADLSQRLAQPSMKAADAVGTGYALAKELEELGRYQESFTALQQAADLQRRQLQYDAAGEFATFAAIRQHFTADFFDSAAQSCDDSVLKPIFILGMPRTGTTLVERILSQHPDVVSIGEFPDFPQELAAAAQQVQGAASLVEAALALDYQALGQRYLTQAAEMAQGKPIFIDKLPFNFMYCGFIKKALPHARIIHLVRDPLDTCYAVYKTLFNQVYSFSYQLEELADYYVEYRKLMTHWHQVLPGQILDVHYEQLVAAPQAQAKRILQWCDLPWRDDLLAFHQASSASTTASAAQVRQPVHQKSVQKWRHFSQQLAPLLRRLQAAGLVDEQGKPL